MTFCHESFFRSALNYFAFSSTGFKMRLNSGDVSTMTYAEQIRKGMRSWIEATPGNELVDNPPASEEEIHRLAESVDRPLPDELKAFYRQANGIWDSWYCFSILSADEAAKYNEKLRNGLEARNCSSRSDHLAFSHKDGDYYYYSLSEGGIHRWNHEDDSCEYVCSDLKAWISLMVGSL